VPERLPEHLLLGRVRQVLLGAHHMSDAHGHVVDDVGEEEHRGAVAAQQHEVLDGAVVELDLAAHEIVHHRGPRRHPEPQHPTRLPVRDPRSRDQPS
jgi:hypothetical protein